jgi:hypothetical protein
MAAKSILFPLPAQFFRKPMQKIQGSKPIKADKRVPSAGLSQLTDQMDFAFWV